MIMYRFTKIVEIENRIEYNLNIMNTQLIIPEMVNISY